MEIFYKCRCMPEEASIIVPDRKEGIDLMVWMNLVQVMLGYDHISRSPNCLATEMEYAKIPYENDRGIGIPATKQ